VDSSPVYDKFASGTQFDSQEDDGEELGMARPEVADITDIEGAKIWMTDHDARIDVYWEQQHELNNKHLETFQEVFTRVAVVEKRLVWLVTVAAGIGSLAGVILSNLIKISVG
jgi:hypothetical protein